MGSRTEKDLRREGVLKKNYMYLYTAPGLREPDNCCCCEQKALIHLQKGRVGSFLRTGIRNLNPSPKSEISNGL